MSRIDPLFLGVALTKNPWDSDGLDRVGPSSVLGSLRSEN